MDDSIRLVWVAKIVIFLSAFLLFSIQPMIAKFILPIFGGTYSVWTMVVFFFTSMLLLGYWYASLVIMWPKWWARAIHSGLLLLTLVSVLLVWHEAGVPLLGNRTNELITDPALSVVGLLAGLIGCVTLVLASTSVITQRVYANVTGKEPYPLYGLSNLGSLLGLLSYPFLLELWLPLSVQATLWATTFMFLTGLLLFLLWRTSPVAEKTETLPAARVVRSIVDTPLLLIFLAALPTFFLASATEYLSKGVASFPLLWVLPLAAYLLSFVAAFHSRRPALPRYSSLVLIPVLVPVLFLMLNSSLTIFMYWGLVALMTIAVFFVGSYFHSHIYDRRPETVRMGRFYVLLTIGGALGSGVVGLLLPLLLEGNLELLWFISVLILYVLVDARKVFLPTAATFWKKVGYGFAIFVFLALPFLIQFASTPIAQTRNFYGTLRVFDSEMIVGSSSVPVRRLLNGSIIHGLQPFTASSSLVKASYYTDASGVGVAISAQSSDVTPPRVLVVGAGVGLMSAYCNEIQTLDYIEINQAVIDVAQNYFTYINSCLHKGEIIIGDGRLVLEAMDTTRRYEVLVIDAFTDDAIPIHLLTREAFLDAYMPHLADNGIIAVHVSNRYLNLVPPLSGVAQELGQRALVVSRSEQQLQPFEHSSIWVLITTDESAEKIILKNEVHDYQGESFVWTDEQSSILNVLSSSGSLLRE